MRLIANRTAALEASEQGFRQIFEEAPIGMAVVGLDERFDPGQRDALPDGGLFGERTYAAHHDGYYL